MVIPLRRVAGPEPPAPLDSLARSGLLVVARYESSPVGPYTELAVAVPSRHGVRPGLTVTTMLVDSKRSAAHGRELWGFPKVAGTLRWLGGPGGAVSVSWEDAAVHVRAQPRSHVRVPVVAIVPLLQVRSGVALRATARLSGRGRLARVAVEAGPGTPLAGVAGEHVAVGLERVRLVVGPPRRCAGRR